jgi:hypothetical protein
MSRALENAFSTPARNKKGNEKDSDHQRRPAFANHFEKFNDNFRPRLNSRLPSSSLSKDDRTLPSSAIRAPTAGLPVRARGN